MTTVSVGFNKLPQTCNFGLPKSSGAFAIAIISYSKLQAEEEIYILVWYTPKKM